MLLISHTLKFEDQLVEFIHETKMHLIDFRIKQTQIKHIHLD